MEETSLKSKHAKTNLFTRQTFGEIKLNSKRIFNLNGCDRDITYKRTSKVCVFAGGKEREKKIMSLSLSHTHIPHSRESEGDRER